MLRSRVLLLIVAVALTAAALPSGASAAKGVVLKCNGVTVSPSSILHPVPLKTGDPATEVFKSRVLATSAGRHFAEMHPQELIRTAHRVVFAVGGKPGTGPVGLITWTVVQGTDGSWALEPSASLSACILQARVDGLATTPFHLGVTPKPRSRSLLITTQTGKCFGKVRGVRQTWRPGSVTLMVLVGKPAATGAECYDPPDIRAVRRVKLTRRLGSRTVLRLVGGEMGIEGIMVHGDEARVTFRDSAVPRLKGLNAAVFAQFKTNPESFIAEAIRLINEQKATVIIEHLAYDPVEDKFDFLPPPTPAAIAKRLHLHARRIVFPHPRGGTVDVTAPLPPHMLETWALFGFDPGRYDEGPATEEREARKR